MNPYAAVVRPADEKNRRAIVRLLPAGRILGKALREACPAGVRVTSRPTPEGLLLITTGSREFTAVEQESATEAVRAAVERLFSEGAFSVEGFTRATLPKLEPGSRVAELIAAAGR